MNSKIIYAALLMLALLIVLPVVSHGNANTAQNISGHSTLTADGSPGPAPVPHGNVLVADGTPAPPPVPRRYFHPPHVRQLRRRSNRKQRRAHREKTPAPPSNFRK